MVSVTGSPGKSGFSVHEVGAAIDALAGAVAWMKCHREREPVEDDVAPVNVPANVTSLVVLAVRPGNKGRGRLGQGRSSGRRTHA